MPFVIFFKRAPESLDKISGRSQRNLTSMSVLPNQPWMARCKFPPFCREALGMASFQSFGHSSVGSFGKSINSSRERLIEVVERFGLESSAMAILDREV